MAGSMRMTYLRAKEDVLAGQFVVYTGTTFRIARNGDEGEMVGVVMADCRKGDRTDNRIENLAVLDAADHGREHFPPEKARRLSRLAQTARWGYIYAAI